MNPFTPKVTFGTPKVRALTDEEQAEKQASESSEFCPLCGTKLMPAPPLGKGCNECGYESWVKP